MKPWRFLLNQPYCFKSFCTSRGRDICTFPLLHLPLPLLHLPPTTPSPYCTLPLPHLPLLHLPPTAPSPTAPSPWLGPRLLAGLELCPSASCAEWCGFLQSLAPRLCMFCVSIALIHVQEISFERKAGNVAHNNAVGNFAHSPYWMTPSTTKCHSCK